MSEKISNPWEGTTVYIEALDFLQALSDLQEMKYNLDVLDIKVPAAVEMEDIVNDLIANVESYTANKEEDARDGTRIIVSIEGKRKIRSGIHKMDNLLYDMQRELDLENFIGSTDFIKKLRIYLDDIMRILDKGSVRTREDIED